MFKNEKGISLVTMIVAVLVIVIILSTLVYTSYTCIKVRNLNKLYNDLRTLTDEVIVYYAENKSIPADTSKAYVTVDANTTNAKTLDIVTTDGTFSRDTLVNPNDYEINTETGEGEAVYYKIDLSLFDNISLSYTGTYIINAQSLMIYYVDGATVDGETYYSLPLSYIATSYGETSSVSEITTKNIYLPMNDTSVKVEVSDYYTLVSEDGKTPTAKSIEYNITSTGYGNYFGLENGKITTLTSTSSNETLPTDAFELEIKASNYDSTEVVATINIYLVDIKVYESIDDEGNLSGELSSLILKSGESKTIYILKRGYGYDSAEFSINGTSVTGVSTGYTGKYSYDLSSSTTGAFSYSIVGTGEILAANTSLNVNVLNINLLDSSSEIVDKLEFTSLDDTKTLTLEVEGIDDIGLTVDSIDWTYQNSSGNAVNYLTAELDSSKSEVTLTPQSFGTVILSGTVNLTDEASNTYSVDLDDITISILGVNILNSTLTMTLNETATLSIVVASDLNAENVVWSSSDSSVSINSSTGEMTAVSNGTSEITASITLTDGTVYSDTCTVTVTE